MTSADRSAVGRTVEPMVEPWFKRGEMSGVYLIALVAVVAVAG